MAVMVLHKNLLLDITISYQIFPYQMMDFIVFQHHGTKALDFGI